MKFVPPGFDADAVIAGLHQAMGFGEPNRAEDKATFYLITTNVDPDAATDAEGVPYDPDAARSTTPTPVVVPCAVEFTDAEPASRSFGAVRSTKITITLLDQDYQAVAGFAYVVCGGDRYYHAYTEPPVALGSIDVWTVHATTRGET